MFEAILDSYEYLTSQADSIALTAGASALTLLSKRFYRVQKVVLASSGAELQPKLFPEAVPQNSYYLLGGNIVTEPVQTGNITVTYSYLPTRFNDLATDATVLADYPDGHESALIYLTAGWAMTKGDAESMQQIGRIGDVALEAMLTHIARRYPIAPALNVSRIKAALIRNPLVSTVSQG